jgi:ParB family transcriptional regulator, chromosome partitioning protein
MEDGGYQAVQMIPVTKITVVNPRVRNRKIFREIIANIAQVGLKKPITVTKHYDPEGGFRYDLVCGQGRLEAFQALGQAEIPALVVTAGEEDCAVMSLVENCARRQHRAIDLLHDVEGLKRRGYDEPEIARKTGLTVEYVRAIIRLLENGEHRLLRAVESGHIPVSIAVDIAQADDAEVQNILQQAYENKLLRGRKLLIAKRLIEQRRRRGKGFRSGEIARQQPLSSTTLIRIYRDDVDRKRILIRKANATRNRLIFITEAMRKLLSEEHFLTLLRAEGLDTLPKNLADRIQAWAQA